jgi:hypothetical protein
LRHTLLITFGSFADTPALVQRWVGRRRGWLLAAKLWSLARRASDWDVRPWSQRALHVALEVMRHTLLILLVHWSFRISGTADGCGHTEFDPSLRSLRSLARRASDRDMRCSPSDNMRCSCSVTGWSVLVFSCQGLAGWSAHAEAAAGAIGCVPPVRGGAEAACGSVLPRCTPRRGVWAAREAERCRARNACEFRGLSGLAVGWRDLFAFWGLSPWGRRTARRTAIVARACRVRSGLEIRWIARDRERPDGGFGHDTPDRL